jgi:hypothetical protein
MLNISSFDVIDVLGMSAQNIFSRSCKCTTSQLVLYIGIWSKAQQIYSNMPLEIGVYLDINNKSKKPKFLSHACAT